MSLAINGGKPVRSKSLPFPAYSVIGEEEKLAAMRVLDSGVLSRFLGCWHEDFYGGNEVQALEKEWAVHFGVKHAISVNSATSGIYAAVGACGIEPGDEVIVSPYTMAASATAPLIYGGIPVFADVEEDYFCLSAADIERRITPHTKAIIVVDIFGLPYDVAGINALAKKHGLKVIEDCAQAPGAKYHDKFAGTLGDVGIYSLNYHKHIHSGEGGVVVTNDDRLADRVRLIRNHAEAVVGDKKEKDLSNMVGFNYRMTEIEAAISRCQLKKLPSLLEQRQANCLYLAEQLAQIPAVTPAKVRPDCTHAYYVQPFKFNESIAETSRHSFIEAVKAELPPTVGREDTDVLLYEAYARPLYLLPIFQNQVAFGSKGWPFKNLDGSPRPNPPSYARGTAPVTERLHAKELFYHEMMRPPMSKADLADVAKAFHKVWENRASLRKG